MCTPGVRVRTLRRYVAESLNLVLAHVAAAHVVACGRQ